MKLTTVLAFAFILLSVACAGTRDSKDDAFCGFSERISDTQTILWDEYATESSVGKKCVKLFHHATKAPATWSEFCVRRKEIKRSCSDEVGVMCMSTCEGYYVDNTD